MNHFILILKGKNLTCFQFFFLIFLFFFFFQLNNSSESSWNLTSAFWCCQNFFLCIRVISILIRSRNSLKEIEILCFYCRLKFPPKDQPCYDSSPELCEGHSSGDLPTLVAPEAVTDVECTCWEDTWLLIHFDLARYCLFLLSWKL